MSRTVRGLKKTKRWTVREWRKDQGVDLHDEINAEWTELLVRKKIYSQKYPPDGKNQKYVFHGQL